MPKPQIEATLRKDEIYGFLKQSHISEKNRKRLTSLLSSGDARIAELAAIVLEVAHVKPHKRRRLRVLAQLGRRDLLQKLTDTGLISAHYG